MNQEMKLSFLYDVDIKNDTYTLLYFDHIEVIHGIPLELKDFIHSGLITIGCICGKKGGEKNGK